MENNESDKLREAIRSAIFNPPSEASSDMKYCMIANLGRVGLDDSERAKLYVANPSIESAAGYIKYVESGLSDNDFAYHVGDVLQKHFYEGNAADLRKVADGVFSVRLSEDAVHKLRDSFPSDRMTLLDFAEPVVLNDVMRGFARHINAPNQEPSRPYLDA